MSAPSQCTIAEKVSCAGVGLHSGAQVELSLQPARAGTGIVFARRHAGQTTIIPARLAALASADHATTLAQGDIRVSTVEHLLAALYALEIDNVVVDLDGPEVPALDGSAQPFVTLVRRAGIFEQRERRPVLRVLRPFEIDDDERRIRIEPGAGLAIDYRVEFAHPAIGSQEISIPALCPALFERELAGARTFAFLEDVPALRRAGLARGGSLENTLVLDETGVLNASGLRQPDEFVRHKALDLVGDLSLLGTRVSGHIQVHRGGHSLHHDLLRGLLADRGAWRLDPVS